MKINRTLSVLFALFTVALFALPAAATNTTYLPGTATTLGKVSSFETASGEVVLIKSPVLAANAGDTLIVVLDISKKVVPYLGANNVPTAKILYSAVQVAPWTSVDSTRVGQEFGYGGKDPSTGVTWFTANATGLATASLMAGKTPLVSLYTNYPFGATWLRLKFCNKHTATARTNTFVVTFPKMPGIQIPRSQF